MRAAEEDIRSGNAAAMEYAINNTKAYHSNSLDTLGWELTVCNALESAGSPCRRILKRNDTYGNHLYDFLSRFIPLQELRRLIEIGGGYGCLARDFLLRNKLLKATMIDVSPYLLERQRDTLKEFDVEYRQADIMDVGPEELRSSDLVILNENLGDLPALIGVDSAIMTSCREGLDDPLQELQRIIERYALNLPRQGKFNVNIGAFQVLEKLCQAGIPYIFLGEHSCEAVVPERLRQWIRVPSPGNPEKISLRGHDEYTISFSHLEKMACCFNYKALRGPYADFLEFDFTDKVRYIMSYSAAWTDAHEIIRHFVEDLCKYEYLILVRK